MAPEAPPQQPDTALSDVAIDWIVKLNSGRATDDDHAAFATWRSQSTDHEQAAQEAEAIWHGVGVAGDEAKALRRKERRTQLTRRAALGGGTLAVAAIALVKTGVIGPRLFADYRTGIAEQRTIPLDDGSSVLLNASSALSVAFNERERRLSLIEGQAAFTVAHDASHPFIVDANGGRTRAAGTVFDVDIRSEEVVVTVVEGVVAVTAGNSPSDDVIVRMDQRVHYASRLRPSSPEAIDANVETAWRRGKLIFNRRPLADVVSDIERYRSGEIILVGESLRSLEVTGVFDLKDPGAILRTIEETLPVHMTTLPFVTIIRSATLL